VNALTGVAQSVAMGYGVSGRDSIPSRATRFFSSPQRLEGFWGSLSLLSNGYWELSP
jgi:hypothetical protein